MKSNETNDGCSAVLSTAGLGAVVDAGKIHVQRSYEGVSMNQGDIKLVIDQLDQLDFGSIEDKHIKNSAVDMLETLGNKVAELEAALASEQQDYQDAEAMLHAERNVSQALREKVAEQEKQIQQLQMALADTEALESGASERVVRQAAVIEKLTTSVKVAAAHIRPTCPELYDTLRAAIVPTDSKQILADWLREQLGKPVAWCHIEDGDTFVDALQYFKDGYSDKPLFKQPECLK